MTDLHTENARLRAALQNVMGHVDTPIGRRRLIAGSSIPEWLTDARAALATPAPDAVQEAARVLLDACPNPLFDRLKPIIMGEVTESIGYTDDVGNERSYKRPVSWTAMKEIIGLALRTLAGERT